MDEAAEEQVYCEMTIAHSINAELACQNLNRINHGLVNRQAVNPAERCERPDKIERCRPLFVLQRHTSVL